MARPARPIERNGVRAIGNLIRRALGAGTVQTTAAPQVHEDQVRTAVDLARVFTTPCSTSPVKTDRLMTLVQQFSRDELRAAFQHDELLSNYVVNHWEFATGEAVLTTYPWKIVVPISDVCNATCTFCNSWLRGVRTLGLDELDRFSVVLRHAAEIGLEGHGEPLVHPEIGELIRRLTEIVDPRCWKYLITNGVRLQRHFDELQKLGINNYSISLNAASAETHHEIMGLGEGAFDQVVASIRQLVAARNELRAKHPGTEVHRQVYLTFVVLNQNIHEVPRFIELGNELDVTAVWLRTLLPQSGLLQGLNYHLLPPYENPDFEKHRIAAIDAIRQSRIRVVAQPESWSAPIFPRDVADRIRTSAPIVISKAEAKRHERLDLTVYREADFKRSRGRKVADVPLETFTGTENPFNRGPGYQCSDVYSVWHWNDFLDLIRPCCYMEHPPGYEYLHYDGRDDFFDAWNSPALIEIRRSLRDGPLISWCKRCPTQTQYVTERDAACNSNAGGTEERA